jgi:signal peptidase I
MVAAIAYVVAATCTSFIATVYVVRSPSMQPTLLIGDYVLVVKLLYRVVRPRRGDIVVFIAPPHPATRRAGGDRALIKRVAGAPGDTIVPSHGHRPGSGVPVPQGTVFVLGDNRAISRDSSTFGAVDQRRLVGRALAIVWPPTRVRCLRRLGTSPPTGQLASQGPLDGPSTGSGKA